MRRCSDNGSKVVLLKRPVITEKSSEAMAEDKYTFDVDTRVNKATRKMAVEEIFNVKVASVNIMNYKPKKLLGRYQGYTNKRRKAIVTLKEGSID
ncbi:50S ribosomal protein L23 [Staphylococcus aureus]